MLWTSAIFIAFISILIALNTLPPTTNAPSETTSASLVHDIVKRVASPGSTIIDKLISLWRGHGRRHHHHHRKKHKKECDKSKWVSPIASDPNVALILTVDLKGCANFSSVQKAIDAVPDYSPSRILIIIDSGVYRSVYFGEYECMGPGANYTLRTAYAKQLDQCEAARFMDISYIDGREWVLPPYCGGWSNPCDHGRHRELIKTYQSSIDDPSNSRGTSADM
ncbi:hypothetical protein COCNU_09G008250 [Cocos nucifera]|uniref:Pectinesterase n=1 Tax=Cocos nucifera TaxID=13894 RepID=A0A8K0IKH9_COCNU|nr:hypothetical protein COCNU_09G008250 [Cocos nucifera]